MEITRSCWTSRSENGHLFSQTLHVFHFHTSLHYPFFISTLQSLTNGMSLGSGAGLKGVQYGSRFKRAMECLTGVGNNGKGSAMWKKWQRSQKPLQPGQWPTWQRQTTWTAFKAFQPQLKTSTFYLVITFWDQKRENKKMLWDGKMCKTIFVLTIACSTL